jgi:hypothetical protein
VVVAVAHQSLLNFRGNNMADTTKANPYEFYRHLMLPIIGLAEVIGTQGKSPGTTAMRSMEQFDTAEERRRRDAEAAQQQAREQELFGMKKEEYGRKTLAEQEQEARMSAYRNRLGQSQTDTDKKAAALDFLAQENPTEYAKLMLRQENPDLYDMLKLQLLQGQVKQQQNPRLSQNTVETMTELSNFPNLLNDLREDIARNKDLMGPATGRIQRGKAAIGMTDEATIRAQGLQQRYEAVKQVVAKAMEGGVLRKEDMPKYEKILGSILLTPQAAYQNISQLEKMLARDYNNKLKAYSAQGYDVRGIEPIEIQGKKPNPADYER